MTDQTSPEMTPEMQAEQACEAKMKKTGRRLIASIATVLALLIALGVTTYALNTVSVRVDDNFVQTGVVDINLNDGKAIIEKDEYLFEPGMTVEKTFFLENRSTWDVYYKLYFENVKGSLATVLTVAIRDDAGNTLWTGTPASLSQGAVSAAADALKMGETKYFTISFFFPPEKGNEAQSTDLSFKLSAQAVQAKNNPDRLFE